MSSYPVSHVMDCVLISSGIRYEMITGRGRDDGRDGKQRGDIDDDIRGYPWRHPMTSITA